MVDHLVLVQPRRDDALERLEVRRVGEKCRQQPLQERRGRVAAQLHCREVLPRRASAAAAAAATTTSSSHPAASAAKRRRGRLQPLLEVGVRLVNQVVQRGRRAERLLQLNALRLGLLARRRQEGQHRAHVQREAAHVRPQLGEVAHCGQRARRRRLRARLLGSGLACCAAAACTLAGAVGARARTEAGGGCRARAVAVRVRRPVDVILLVAIGAHVLAPLALLLARRRRDGLALALALRLRLGLRLERLLLGLGRRRLAGLVLGLGTEEHGGGQLEGGRAREAVVEGALHPEQLAQSLQHALAHVLVALRDEGVDELAQPVDRVEERQADRLAHVHGLLGEAVELLV